MWDSISTLTRRPAATAAIAAPPAVDYGFEPGGAPRPSARRVNSPPRVPRPRPGPPTAATPAPAASSVPTVPIPSDRDRAEPVETPPLRLTPPLGDTPPAPAKLDALGDADKLQFADSVARYSHADRERQQQAEPTCHATRRYITPSAGRRPCQPTFIVLPFAQPTAFTAGCGFVRRSVSSPGTTRSVFWHRTTLEPDARGVASPLLRYDVP